MPAWPPIVQRLPTTVLPAIPAQACHGGVLADTHIVRNLDQVIQLNTIADDGIAERAAINRRIGADFNLVADKHAPYLRDLLPSFSISGKTKAVAADYRARLEQTFIAYHAAFADKHVRH